MILTEEERSKFALYCEQCAHDEKIIVEQMAKLMPATIVNAMNQHKKAEIAAYTIVAGLLRSTHSDEIGRT